MNAPPLLPTSPTRRLRAIVESLKDEHDRHHRRVIELLKALDEETAVVLGLEERFAVARRAAGR